MFQDQDRGLVDYTTICRLYHMDYILKIIHLGFEKSQRSVTHYFLRYINILTYLVTYQISASGLFDLLT